MTAMQAMRKVEAKPLDDPADVDDVLVASGAIDEDDVELHRDYKPGETIWSYGDRKDTRTEVKMQGEPEDFEEVVIYRIDGTPVVMTRALAEVRLDKRFPATHKQHPGKRVFYRRPPVQRPEPTLACPMHELGLGFCRKRLYTAYQAEKHFETKHPETWAQHQRRVERERQDRMVAAQERQAELMEKLLSQGQPVPPNVAPESVEAPQPAAAQSEPPSSEEPLPAGRPTMDWKRSQMKAFCKQAGLPLPQKEFGLSKEGWLEHINEVMAGGAYAG